MLISFSGNTVWDVIGQIREFMCAVNADVATPADVDTMVKVPTEGMLPDEEDEDPVREALMQEIKPVLTQAQMEENLAKAPVHEDPPQPTFEEVRKALKDMRDRKGTDAVKLLLADYGAKNATELTEVSYRSVYDRAIAEV